MTIGAFELAAATTGGVAAACAVLLLVAGPLRRWLPELCVAACAVAVTWVGAWAHAGPVPTASAAGLAGVAALAYSARAILPARALTPRALAWRAAIGGALFGGLPTAAVLVPAAPDARTGARIALIAHASGLVSPIGSPARILVAWDPAATLTLAPLALVGVAVAWPWRAPQDPVADRPAIPAPLIAVILLSAALTSFFGPIGAALLLTTPLLAGTSTPTRSPRTPLTMARLSAAAWLIAAAVSLSGGAWWFGRGLVGATNLAGPAAPAAVGLVLGNVAEPVVSAALLASAGEALGDAAAPARWLALGLACAPLPTVALATYHHGRSAALIALSLAALQMLLAVAWGAAVFAPSIY